MKKVGLAVLAMLLVIPALGNAGTVSSRYDVVFGGYLKYDLGYSTQNTHVDPMSASRSSTSDRAVFADEFGNTLASSAESRFNFLIKGPDLWGAKTSAFIEGDFRGTNTGNSYGGFQLRHAFMTLKWESAELMMGQNWQQWGQAYFVPTDGFCDFAQYLKGLRTPQVAYRYFFTKELNAMVGLTSATEASGVLGIRGYNDGYARSGWPGFMGEVAYWSDRLGKIGPWNLKLGLGGYYGRDKETYVDPNNSANYKDSTISSWIAAFRYMIPIIPEKKGDKAMALLLNGNFFIGQNPNGTMWMGGGPPSNGAYMRPNYDATSPTLFGLFSMVSWWLTDQVSVNAGYGYLKYNFSEWGRSNSQTARDLLNMSQTYVINLMWEPTKNIIFGLEWGEMFTGYNGVGPGTGTGSGNAARTGTVDQYRLGVWYFF